MHGEHCFNQCQPGGAGRVRVNQTQAFGLQPMFFQRFKRLRQPRRGQHQAKGFNVLLRNHSIMVQYGCGDDDTDTVTAFGADRYSGWIHVALSFDTRSCETVCYLNFQRAHTDRIAPSYAESLPNGGRFVIGDDDCMTFNRSRGLIFRMDDLLILNDTLTDADVAALGRLYE